jgi:acetylornithine deacetylase
MYGRGAGDMKSGTIAALFALDAIRSAGLAPTARIHFQSVIEEESTGVGALSTVQRGYRAQVGVIWFRVRVRGRPVHVSEAGAGANAIKAAYHLIHALEGLEEEWNERARTDINYKAVQHPINFNPGIIRGGDWASSVPAWCDVDCRLAVLPGWSVKACQDEIVACVNAAARQHAFLDKNRPVVEWSGFQCEGFELTDAGDAEAVLQRSYGAVYGGELQERAITATTDARYYGLNAAMPSLCFGASAERSHGFNECVDLQSLRNATGTIALFVADWCGIEKA